MSATFYHHTGNKLMGRYKGRPRDYANVGDECPPVTVGPKARGDEECRLNERWFYD